MPPPDGIVTQNEAQGLLADCHVARCTLCGLSTVRAPMSLVNIMAHACGGQFQPLTDPLHRSVLLRLLSRGFVQR
jgi:hypothetical protein